MFNTANSLDFTKYMLFSKVYIQHIYIYIYATVCVCLRACIQVHTCTLTSVTHSKTNLVHILSYLQEKQRVLK